MTKNLLIFGAKKYECMIKEIAEEMKCFEKIDFLESENEVTVESEFGHERLMREYSYAFVAIEDAELRLKWIRILEAECYRIAILVHPRAYIAPSAQLWKGTSVGAMAVVNAGSVVATGCIVSAGAVVDQSCFIGDGCYIDSNAVVTAGSIVPAGTKVGCREVFTRERSMELLGIEGEGQCIVNT